MIKTYRRSAEEAINHDVLIATNHHHTHPYRFKLIRYANMMKDNDNKAVVTRTCFCCFRTCLSRCLTFPNIISQQSIDKRASAATDGKNLYVKS